MRQLRARCALPLAIDEATVGPAEFLAYVREGLADYLEVKLAGTGGVWSTASGMGVRPEEAARSDLLARELMP